MELSLRPFKIQLIKQGGLFIVYSHKLDISTTGKSEKQALGNFADLAKFFTKDMIAKEVDRPGASTQQLLEMGWTNRAKRWTPPLTAAAKK